VDLPVPVVVPGLNHRAERARAQRLPLAKPIGVNVMTEAHAPAAEGHHEHGVSFPTYMRVFGALCFFTAISFVFNSLGRSDTITPHTAATMITLVAVIKAVIVATFFMHLLIDWTKLYYMIIPALILAVLMIVVLMPDIVLGWHYGSITPPTP
jgi:caa(3)-type oxidase subunit IV